jgi:single-strand DNA-binding protein
MSKDLNKIMITGHLGADPEMRFTPQGTPVTTFRVAAGRTWKDAGGAQHSETEWFRVVAWNKLAEVCNEYLQKGDRVYIEGRVQTRTWQDKDGQDRATTEIVASDMIMLASKRRLTPPPTDEAGEEVAIRDNAPATRAGRPSPTRSRKASPTTAPPRKAAFEPEDLPF